MFGLFFDIKKYQNIKAMDKKRYPLNALASAIIPGLGQLLKGQVVKGLLIIVLGITISYLLIWTVVFPIVLWGWNVYDAYTSTSEQSIVENKQ